jgi:hypothetical protein
LLIEINSTDNFKKFINSLRCPLCQSQLDGSAHCKEARLYCVANNDEYKVTWKPDTLGPENELITHYYGQYKYIISITRFEENYVTSIDRFNNDFSIKYINSSRKNMFKYTGDRINFFRQKIDEQSFLNKLKLYSVFS